MSFVRETTPGTFVEIDQNAAIVINNVTWPSSIYSTWSLEDLAIAGIYPVVPFEVPAGKKITGSPTYTKDGTQVLQTYETVDDKPPVPEYITRRQLILALWQLGFISEDDAMSVASGGVPANIKNEFDKLPGPERTAAYITFATMSACYRNDPLLEMVSSALNVSKEQMDDWFHWAGTL